MHLFRSGFLKKREHFAYFEFKTRTFTVFRAQEGATAPCPPGYALGRRHHHKKHFQKHFPSAKKRENGVSKTNDWTNVHWRLFKKRTCPHSMIRISDCTLFSYFIFVVSSWWVFLLSISPCYCYCCWCWCSDTSERWLAIAVECCTRMDTITTSIVYSLFTTINFSVRILSIHIEWNCLR